mmetsp:Transcript_41342/g.66506  ORF Transcript_41342/g.66506 Transcript_41342/m.66506 type:complete len:84 (-) Transcript_41342:687-938(-)
MLSTTNRSNMARLAYLTTDNDNNNNNSKPSIREVALLSQQRHPTYKIVIVVYCRGFKSIEVRVILDVFKGFFEIRIARMAWAF